MFRDNLMENAELVDNIKSKLVVLDALTLLAGTRRFRFRFNLFNEVITSLR